MNKNGTGVGSASIILVFAVLCLTIFALITFSAAQNDMALARAEARLVESYYGADAEAENILAGLLAAPIPPREEEFTCAISAGKELYVHVALNRDSYDILSWRMRDTGEWQADDSIPVWDGIQMPLVTQGPPDASSGDNK